MITNYYIFIHLVIYMYFSTCHKMLLHILPEFPICLSISLFPIKTFSSSLLSAPLSLWNSVLANLFSLWPSDSLSGGGLFLINSLGCAYRSRIFSNVNFLDRQVWGFTVLSPADFSSFNDVAYLVTFGVLALSYSPVSSFSFPVPSAFK